MGRPIRAVQHLQTIPQRTALEQAISDLNDAVARVQDRVAVVVAEAARVEERATAQPSSDEDYVSVAWVRERTSLSKTMIYSLVEAGQLAGLKIGARVIVSRAGYEALIARLREAA